MLKEDDKPDIPVSETTKRKPTRQKRYIILLFTRLVNSYNHSLENGVHSKGLNFNCNRLSTIKIRDLAINGLSNTIPKFDV